MKVTTFYRASFFADIRNDTSMDAHFAHRPTPAEVLEGLEARYGCLAPALRRRVLGRSYKVAPLKLNHRVPSWAPQPRKDPL